MIRTVVCAFSKEELPADDVQVFRRFEAMVAKAGWDIRVRLEPIEELPPQYDVLVVSPALRVFDLTQREVQHQIVLGSPALGLCYVAAGRLQAYWTMQARPWDVAAAGLIVCSSKSSEEDRPRARLGAWRRAA